MKILNYGSLNIDMVFTVPHIVRDGETLASSSLMKNAGGKGANQSAALGKAGCRVFHAGKIGKDGAFIVDLLRSYGVDTRFIRITDEPSGQAIIQLDDASQNAIILLPGENKRIGRNEIDETLAFFEAGDWLVLQNEINEIGYLIEQAHQIGMRICFNPAPFEAYVVGLPLSYVDLFVVNEIEGAMLSGSDFETDPELVLEKLNQDFPSSEIILTVGREGAFYACGTERRYQPIIDRPVVDTTGAGDTFLGYFLASRLRDLDAAASLEKATLASAFTVSRKGAMESIPYAREVFGGEA